VYFGTLIEHGVSAYLLIMGAGRVAGTNPGRVLTPPFTCRVFFANMTVKNRRKRQKTVMTPLTEFANFDMLIKHDAG